MARGENVGTAYVRIIADGTGLGKSIRDEFKDANVDEAFEAEGKKAGEKYAAGIKEELGQAPSRDVLRDGLAKAIRRSDLANQFFASGSWKEFQRSMRTRFKDVGEIAVQNLENEFKQGKIDFSGLTARMDRILPEIERATKQVQKVEEDYLRDRNAAYAEQDRRLAEQRRRMLDEAYRMNKTFNDRQKRLIDSHFRYISDREEAFTENSKRLTNERDAAFEQSVRRNKDIADRLVQQFERITEATERITSGQSRTGDSRRRLLRDIEALGPLMRNAGVETEEFKNRLADLEKGLRLTHPSLARLDNGLARLSNGVGRAFGKGSRNDALNFIGSLAGGITGLLRIIPNLTSGLLNVAGGFQSAFSAARAGGGGGLAATFAGLRAAAGGLSVALLAIPAALLGVMLLVGPLVGLLSGLLGIITALVGTITLGLIGALVAVGGALAVLVAGIGVAILAFRAFDSAATNFQPLVRAFNSLGESAAATMFANLERQVRRLAPAVRSLTPLFGDVGAAISRIGDYWIDAVSGPGFTSFRRSLETFLPNAVESLGRTFGNVLGGFGGVFTAMQPLLTRFLGWLEKVTGEFARWANSVEGQRELKSFFDDVGDAAESLGKFLGKAGEALGKLFRKGNDTGTSILDKMADAMERFGKFLDENPDAVDRWFANAEELAGDIGKLVDKIIKLGDAFDTASTRAQGSWIVKGLGGALGVIAAQARLTEGALSTVFGFLGSTFSEAGREAETAGGAISRAWGRVKDSASADGQSIRDAWGRVQAFFARPDFLRLGPGARNLGNELAGMGRNARDRLISQFGPTAVRIQTQMQGIPRKVRTIMLALPPLANTARQRLISRFAGVAGGIVGHFQGVRSRVRTVMVALPPLATTARNRLVNAFQGTPGRIAALVQATRGRIRTIMVALPPLAQTARNRVVAAWQGTPGRIAAHVQGVRGRLNTIWNALPQPARNAARFVVIAFQGIAGKIASHFTGIAGRIRDHFNAMVDAAADIPGRIASQFSGLAGRIIGAVGTIRLPTPTIRMPDLPGPLASGAVVEGMRGIGVVRTLGEAGPEAVVPLNRPLSQVDPSVRWLSAIAQGKRPPAMAAGGTTAGKHIDASGWQIVSPNADPRAVATEVVNRLVAVGY